MIEPVAKPQVGETVYFYAPDLLRKIGFDKGYANRGIGPYAGIVVNDNHPGDAIDLVVFYPERQPAFVHDKVPAKPETPPAFGQEKAYWDWVGAAQKARAVKRLKDDTAS